MVIEFESARGLILIKGRINGSRPLSLLLDSGAGTSVIDESLIESLGLSQIGFETAEGAGGSVDAQRLQPVEVQIGARVVGRIPFIGLPIKGIEAALGKTVDGILGCEFFEQGVVTIDYAEQVVHLGAPPFQNQATEVIAFQLDDGVPLVRIRMKLSDGRTIEGMFGLDTGAQRGLTFYAPFTDENQLLPFPGTAQTLQSGGVGGQRGTIMGRLEEACLGRFCILRPLAVASPSAPPGALDSTQRAGLLGYDILQQFTMSLDYARGEAYLTPNAHFGTPIESDMVGIGLQPLPHGIAVTRVVPESPAEEAGIKVGDLLVQVNGEAVSTLRLEEVESRFRIPGQSLDLKLIRDEIEWMANVVTRRLI